MGKDNPLCKCGCGKQVSKPTNKYISGHNTFNSKHSKETKLKISKSNKGRKFSKDHCMKISNKMSIFMNLPKTKERISREHTGMSHSIEAKRKMSQNHKGSGFLGHSHSSKTIEILRNKTCNHLKKYGIHKGFSPNIGKNETKILDCIESEIDYVILRNEPIQTNKTVRYPDGYIKELNLIIEIDEIFHFSTHDTISNDDIHREDELYQCIKCTFYRIKDSMWDTEKEIIIKEIKQLTQYMK